MPNIRYLDFQQAFKDRPFVEQREIQMRFPEVHRNTLAQWQAKGQLLKIRNGFYRVAHRAMNDQERWAIANAICRPSYVSLRAAFGFYGFIPEGVFHVESVTTQLPKRMRFDNTWYSYRMIKPSFFFGYRFIAYAGTTVMMATPEKALLDFLYLHTDMNGPDDFESWRFDQSGILQVIKQERMNDYLTVADSAALTKRYQRFNTWLHDLT